MGKAKFHKRPLVALSLALSLILALGGAAQALVDSPWDVGLAEAGNLLSGELKAYAKSVSRSLADEGMVLLKNEGGALPLDATEGPAPVSFFGIAQNKWFSTSFYDGLDANFTTIMDGARENAKIGVDEVLAEWYAAQGGSYADGAIPGDVLAAAAARFRHRRDRHPKEDGGRRGRHGQQVLPLGRGEGHDGFRRRGVRQRRGRIEHRARHGLVLGRRLRRRRVPLGRPAGQRGRARRRRDPGRGRQPLGQAGGHVRQIL